MNIYKINSDHISDDEFVVAGSITDAIKLYCEKYADLYVTEESITKIERTAEKCLF